MVIEEATIRVKAGEGPALEAAVGKAVDVFRQVKGCLGVHLQRCVEEPDRYQLIVRWRTLADHTEGFRGSELFQQWRALAGPHFAEPPSVLHFEMAVERADF